MSSDAALLAAYARTRDAEAFAELARRHGGLVYGVCLRITGNSHDADDVAQECFMQLMRKAGSVNSPLPAWLHVTATSRSRNMLRSASRRKRREEQAMSQKPGDHGTSWAEIAPHVDEALTELDEEVRVPMLLHYLEGSGQVEIAEELGVSQSTISRRIEKGTAQLRDRLKKAGVVAPVLLLTALLTEKAAVAAPATLGAALGKMALAGIGAAKATAVTTSVIGGATMIKAGLIAVAAAAVLVVGLAVKKQTTGESPAAASEADLIREAVGARLERMSNLIVRYKLATDYGSARPGEPLTMDGSGGSLLIRIVGYEELEKEFSCLGSMVRSQARLVRREYPEGQEPPAGFREHALTIYAVSADRVESLRRSEGMESFMGAISNQAPGGINYLEIGLGRRTWLGGMERFDAQSLDGLELTFRDADHPLLRKTGTRGVTHEFVLSRQLGFAPIEYFRRVPPDDRVDIRMEMAEFKNVKGLMLPHRMEMRVIARDNDQMRVTETRRVEVTEYLLDDPSNTPDRYHIEFPPNTFVRDIRSGLVLKARLESIQAESVEETIENLANFDDQNLARTSISGLAYMDTSPAFQRLVVTRLSRVRRLLDQGRRDPQQVVQPLRRSFAEALAGWSEAFMNRQRARQAAEDAGQHGLTRSGPDQYRKYVARSIAATYLLAELGDHQSLPLMLKCYQMHAFRESAPSIYAPVPPALTLYAMHRLVLSFPEEQLADEARLVREGYLQLAECLPPAEVITVTRNWAAYYDESDPRVTVFDPKGRVLSREPTMEMVVHADVFTDGEQILNPEGRASERADLLFRELERFVEAAYPAWGEAVEGVQAGEGGEESE